MPAWSIGCRSITKAWRRSSIICRARRWRSTTRPRRCGRDRLATIADFYAARRTDADAPGAARSIAPLKPEQLYLDDAEWAEESGRAARGAAFALRRARRAALVFDAGAQPGHDFAAARADPKINLFDAVRDHIEADEKAGRRVLDRRLQRGLGRPPEERAEGSRHGGAGAGRGLGWRSRPCRKTAPGLAVLPLEHGYVADDAALITEQDILGDRLSRPARRRANLDHFIAEVAALNRRRSGGA